jgi:imidazolonepropionase-like amidohydrolase
MRFLINEFPGVFAPEEVLAMATIGSARALHLDEKVGSLEKGKRADFLVVQPGRPVPHEGVAELLIEDSRLLEVYINGNLV